MTHSSEILRAAAHLNIRPEAVETWLAAGQGRRAPGVERAMHTTVKPAGSVCNLDCTYCYYLSKEELLDQTAPRLEDARLEQFIEQYIAATDGPEIPFTWHGGEPTLMGLDFFRRVVALQRKHLPPGRRIANDLQTNGVLLDDAWCAFLAAEGFLVGISLDGPRHLHDVYRRNKGDGPTFDRVFAATQRLRRHGVTLSVLVTVNRKNAAAPLEVYRFLRDEVGARFLQFIPCVEPKHFEKVAPGAIADRQRVPIDSPRARPGHPMSVVTEWSVDPEDWGSFLAEIFDEWSVHDRARVKINLFESMFAQLAGRPALQCTSSPVCGKNVALEHDGRVYSCDHFVYPEHEIGRVGDRPFSEIVFSLKQLEFGLAKHNALPAECRACPYLKVCWGECPRTRILRTDEQGKNLSYLCSGWKRFFGHALPRIEVRSALLTPASLVRKGGEPDDLQASGRVPRGPKCAGAYCSCATARTNASTCGPSLDSTSLRISRKSSRVSAYLSYSAACIEATSR